ncbi:cytochrome P450 9e2-like [Calliopsis andreniformis]|uniref:cytochrome P450 9e2-like n=1 Tax=Calliopsis andreniformis TaxID=337506 RepID=UPI003FCC2D9F
MDNLSFILSILAIFLVVYYSLKNRNIFKNHGVPYVSCNPIVGNMGPLLLGKYNLMELLQEIYDSHPEARYVGWYELSSPRILLRDIDLIKSVCIKNFEYFQDHQPATVKELDPLFSMSLFSINGNTWKKTRALTSSALASGNIKVMFKWITKCATNFANDLSTLPKEEREISLKPWVLKYIIDMVMSQVFDISIDSRKDTNNLFHLYTKEAANFDGLMKSFKLLLFRNMQWIAKIVNIKLIRKRVSNFFFDQILSAIKIRDEQGIQKQDILQAMIKMKTFNYIYAYENTY